MFNTHESGKNQGHNYRGKNVHGFEPAPKKTDDNTEKSHYIDVMAQFRCMVKELYQSNLPCIGSHFFHGLKNVLENERGKCNK